MRYLIAGPVAHGAARCEFRDHLVLDFFALAVTAYGDKAAAVFTDFRKNGDDADIILLQNIKKGTQRARLVLNFERQHDAWLVDTRDGNEAFKNIPLRQDADQHLVVVNDGKAADPLVDHDNGRILKRIIDVHGVRIGRHDFFGLLFRKNIQGFENFHAG